MRTYRGRWVARVEQEFEVDAEDDGEARDLVERQMNPVNVVELLDMEIVELEEVTD